MDNVIPRVSVIVRTKNCDKIIAQSLTALFSQDFADVELIVVDSGSTDRTLEIVRRYPCRLIQMNPDEYLSGRALNLGAASARTGLLVFQNSDTVPLVPSAMRRLIETFDDPDVQAAFARQMPRPDARSWVRLEVGSAFPDGDHTPPWIPFAAPFSAMRKTAWEEHPFFEDAWGSEDVEWGYWARENGKKVKYVKDALVMHSHNHNRRQLYGRLYTEGEAMALILHDKDTIPLTFMRAAASMLREFTYALRHLYLADIPTIPIRRAVFHWAYYKGHKLGEYRLLTDNHDATMGQRIILKRYEG